MIPVEELLYEVDLKLNKVATQQHQDIPDENKLVALNTAQINFIINKLGTNNTYQLGLDAFKKRYEDLQTFIVPFEDHKLEAKEVDTRIHKWQTSTTTLSPAYMFYIDSYLIASKGICKNKVISVNNDLTKHANVITLLNNSNYVPSFEYEETFLTISENELEYYTDGTFSIDEVYVTYLRYPKEIDVEGYIKLDGTESIHQDSEFPYYLKDTLANMALLELGLSIENQSAIQSAQLREQRAE